MRTSPDVELNPRDVPAGLDSTGQQRGLQSSNGAVICTGKSRPFNFGKIMDVEVLSKHCT